MSCKREEKIPVVASSLRYHLVLLVLVVLVLLLVLTLFTLLSYKTVRKTKLATLYSDDLTPQNLIRHYGYKCETHYITTTDGYILQYHRIPFGIHNTTKQRPAVLLMHGLGSSSADFVNAGPKRDLGYILADLGYDVWLANARGNAFSRNHTTLDPVKDAKQFYDFSWHEISYYDVTSAIDYILGLKEDTSLYYIGHSQGATVFLAFAAARPEYNAKIRHAALMAPAVLFNYCQDFMIRFFKSMHLGFDPVACFATILNILKIYEIPFVKAIRTICKHPPLSQFCYSVYRFIDSENGEEIEKNLLPIIFANLPSNAAVKQGIHYLQIAREGTFARFDYGYKKNLEIYGTPKPPPYELSNISIPVAFYYGANDDVVAVQDVKTLIKMVPKVSDDYLVPDPLFDHADFLFHKNVVKLVYSELINVMRRY